MKQNTVVIFLCFISTCISIVAKGELVIFDNGDQLKGSIVSLDAKELKLQNQNLGLVVVPREKIASIVLKENIPGIGAKAAAAAQPTSARQPGSTNDPIALLQNGIDPKILEQVQNQFLGNANPEAQAMFNDTLSGLVSGRINLDDLREQARTALNELKAVQNDLDEEDTALLGMYSGILERFIAQGTHATGRSNLSTNQPAIKKDSPNLPTSRPGKLDFQTPSRKSSEED